MNKYLLVASSLVLSACSTQAITQEVFIPTKCKVDELPQKPSYDIDNPYDNIKGLLIYLKLIEPILDYCVEEKK